MVRERSSGLMELSMRETGSTIELMGLESSFMLIEMNMKGSGLTTKLMDEEFIDIRTELLMMDSGRMISSMAKAWRSGLTVVSIKENTSKVRNTGMDSTNGMMDRNMRVSGKKTRFLGLECTLG